MSKNNGTFDIDAINKMLSALDGDLGNDSVDGQKKQSIEDDKPSDHPDSCHSSHYYSSSCPYCNPYACPCCGRPYNGYWKAPYRCPHHPYPYVTW